MSKFELAIDSVLRHEGGFSNDPTDPGGTTNFGISLRYLVGAGIDVDGDGDVDAEDIRLLTKEQAAEIYRNRWWNKYNYSAIVSQPLATKIFDTSVNVGAPQSHIFLQRSLNNLFGNNLNVDGKLGPTTLAAVNVLGTNDSTVLALFRQQQMRFYRLLITQKPELEKYQNGWLRRANS